LVLKDQKFCAMLADYLAEMRMAGSVVTIARKQRPAY